MKLVPEVRQPHKDAYCVNYLARVGLAKSRLDPERGCLDGSGSGFALQPCRPSNNSGGGRNAIFFR